MCKGVKNISKREKSEFKSRRGFRFWTFLKMSRIKNRRKVLKMTEKKQLLRECSKICILYKKKCYDKIYYFYKKEFRRFFYIIIRI